MTTTDATPLEYRPFLDGLRAFAVLAVIAYHVDGAAAPGGFLGVDVFFVLSGYLITRLLLAEKARHGRVDFVEFYARRARRLLPAVLLVLAVVVFASHWLYDPMARYTITRTVLSSRPAVWLGKISYGMYLWHWPILIALSRTSLRRPERSVAVVALTIAIAALSYHLLERPIRTARIALGRPISSRGVLLGALAAIALFGGALALRLRGSEPPAWAGDSMTVTGSGSFRIALIGDSIVRSTAPGWQEVAAREGWTLIDGSMGGCSIAGGFQVNSIGKKYGFSKKCRHETPRVLDETAAQRPDLVIWQSHSEVNGLMDLATNQPHQPGSPEHDAMLQQGWETAWARFKDVDVVIVEAVPAGPRLPRSCADDPAMCADDGSSGLIDHLNDLLRDFASKHPRVRFVTIAQAVCPAGPPCPRMIDGITIRYDGLHYTPEAAPLVVNAITTQILPILPVMRPP